MTAIENQTPELTTVMITGGAGFIGSNFVRLLAAEEHVRLILLDALTYAGNLANVADLIDDERVVFLHRDIRDAESVKNALARYRVDRVVHFAAESHVDRSIIGPQPFVDTNVSGTLSLLTAAHEDWRGDASKRFLHVSTDEVYGTLSPEDPPFTETTPYAPNSPYAASKAASDHLVRAWHHTYGFPAVITNCSNNYGPWQFPEKLIPLMVLNAIEGKHLPVYGDGLQVRDWLHVQDHCEALRLVLEKGRSGETYCVGGNNEQANIHVVETVCELVDERLSRSRGTARQLIRHVEDRPGHDRRYAIDAGKLQQELGWSPRIDFHSGLADVVDWYLSHGEWVDAIRSGEYLGFYEQQYAHRLKGAS